MAEIAIERKKDRNWLPLLILGVLLAAVIGYWYTHPRETTGTLGTADSTRAAGTVTGTLPAAGAAVATAAGATTAGATGTGAAIDQFAQFVQQRDTSAETEGRHAYTAEGTRRLAAALEAAAGTSPSIAVYADSMRSSIDRLQRSGPSDVHADDAKAAFSAAVSAMAQIDKARGRTRDVAPMRAVYATLSSTQPLLPQLATVQRFFAAASDALQAMR